MAKCFKRVDGRAVGTTAFGLRAQTMPLTVAAQNATRGPQWWYMSVLILIMIIPVIAVAIALERFISRGLLVGAVKG